MPAKGTTKQNTVTKQAVINDILTLVKSEGELVEISSLEARQMRLEDAVRDYILAGCFVVYRQITKFFLDDAVRCFLARRRHLRFNDARRQPQDVCDVYTNCTQLRDTSNRTAALRQAGQFAYLCALKSAVLRLGVGEPSARAQKKLFVYRENFKLFSRL